MNPIKTGIIGFGRSGCGIHADAIALMPETFTVTAICDELPDRRHHPAFPHARAYAAAGELLADPEIELVVVATYNYQHALLARQALDAGKHVLCEKPFGFTTADVDAMIAAARRNHRILQPFQQRRYEEDFQKVREICQSGILGKILNIRLCWGGFGRRWDWQTSRRFGGGQLYNNGPHLVDHGMELFGATEPEVTFRHRNALSSGDAEDEFSLLLRGNDAPDVELNLTATSAFEPEKWLIRGTAGTLRGTSEKLEWKYVDWRQYNHHSLDLHPLADRKYCSEKLDFQIGQWTPERHGDTGAGAKPAPEPVRRLYAGLYQAVRNGRVQEITPEQIRRRVAVMEQCYRQAGIPFPENTLVN